MISGPTCRCLLCRIETQLIAELASSIGEYEALRSCTASALRAFASPFHLLSHLKATQAGPSSDELFRELLMTRSVQPPLIDMLMIVAFVPVLHGTVRRIAKQQSHLARSDITQQALTVFLQTLRSEEMEKRQSHFAFAISRSVKRQLFEWAGQKSVRDGVSDNGYVDSALQLGDDQKMERHALLRHFLHRCVSNGHIDDAELDLLIEVKLDGNTGDETAEAHSISSNAVRQRMKRLLAKLRRLAENGSHRSHS
jgi:DNA-directed RNA polymerase specialized sigma24 family protein